MVGESKIIVDSGASRHLTGNKEWYNSLDKLDTLLTFLAAKGKNFATHCGNILVDYSDDGVVWRSGLWKNVLFVPGLSTSLFSTICAKDAGFSFSHANRKMM
jgi:hypothetical protein